MSGKSNALWSKGRCRVVAEQCEIFDTAEAAADLAEDSSTVFRNCTVRNAKKTGILIEKHAEAQLSGCNLFGCGSSALATVSDGPVTVEHCRLHDNKGNGALIAENARAALWDCDIENNALSGVYARGNEQAVIEDCRFRGATAAVTLVKNGKVMVYHCTVAGAAGEAWTVETGSKLSGSENTPVLPDGSLPDSVTLGAWRRWPFRVP
jgi:hypothetical protein